MTVAFTAPCINISTTTTTTYVAATTFKPGVSAQTRVLGSADVKPGFQVYGVTIKRKKKSLDFQLGRFLSSCITHFHTGGKLRILTTGDA